jgi:hypothetical protein
MTYEKESISNRGLRGLLLHFRLLFALHSRIPANEGLPELVIEYLRPHLEQIVGAGFAPLCECCGARN